MYTGAGFNKMSGIMSEEKPKSKIKEQIDQSLKRVYEDILNEEVPDRFKQLLAQLREKDSGGGKTS